MGYNLFDYRTTVAIIQKSLCFRNCTTKMMQLSVLVFLGLRIIHQCNSFYSVVQEYSLNTEKSTYNNSCLLPFPQDTHPCSRWKMASQTRREAIRACLAWVPPTASLTRMERGWSAILAKSLWVASPLT